MLLEDPLVVDWLGTVGPRLEYPVPGALAVLLLAFAPPSSAQSYPSKPIRFLVGFAPGGAADIIARVMSDPLTRALGQGVIVDNKPGAGSSLAAEYVAKAKGFYEAEGLDLTINPGGPNLNGETLVASGGMR